MAECFNSTPLKYGPGSTTADARNFGGLLYGKANGKLSLESHWFYGFEEKTPQRVLLTNALSGEWIGAR